MHMTADMHKLVSSIPLALRMFSLVHIGDVTMHA